jgi:hypothetical protein
MMAWRNHASHKEETKTVKTALKAAGINAKVGHGSGTAWAWLEINIGSGQQFGEHINPDRRGGLSCSPDCRKCREMKRMRDETQRIVREVTGRHGDHGGEILVLTQDAWNQKKKCSVPITHPDWKEA